jgi:glycosyltransferase involved in cell wall biosynthesis
VHVGFSLLTLFPGRVGGSETNARGLLRRFAEGDGPELVTVLANRHVAATYAGYARGPVAVHHVRSYRAGDSMATRAIAMAVARGAPRLVARDVPPGLDVVHFPVTVPIPRTGLPEVVTLFDVQHLDMPAFFSRAERLYRRWAYEGAARAAAVAVTSSEYSRRRLIESADLDPGRIEVVYLGIDHERFNLDASRDEEYLARLELPERFIVYPANFWPHKNHMRLVEALARAQDSEICLVLTGQPYGRLEPLMKHASRAGVAARVRHLGFVEHAALPAIFRRAKGMIFPSLYEGFGAPPLEAMACGCPVAASMAGSLREVCADAAIGFDAGSVEDIAQAIDRITADAGLRARLRSSGLCRALEFDWGTAAKRHVAIYDRAAATSGSQVR